ncbi:hypothetical protein KSF78_0009679 [Schistosoma japonicum]|nr:hypothetical protein KSF78_0009679 [Schistosoma japonicum]
MKNQTLHLPLLNEKMNIYLFGQTENVRYVDLCQHACLLLGRFPMDVMINLSFVNLVRKCGEGLSDAADYDNALCAQNIQRSQPVLGRYNALPDIMRRYCWCSWLSVR